jgi:pyridinium-3,5-bisthiocarboxylic acid mononucleotide nickel chelatase
MKIGYLECFAGISGDMLLGALIDAGVSPDLLQQTAQGLGIGAELKIHHVDRSGIRSTKVDVLENGKLAETIWSSHSHEHSHSHDHPHSHPHSHDHEHRHDHKHGRSWAQIRELITHAAVLPADARALALETFRLLAEAEGKIHGIPVDDVHFHEVGAVDTITDIVCSAAGVCSLKIDQWYSTHVNIGGGTVECAHGTFPVPAPATAELLKGIPTYSAGLKKELVTPTGAALLRALKCSYGETPRMSTDAIGYGAGSRNPEKLPNVLRLSIGEGRGFAAASSMKTDTVIVLECAIDDASPQVLAHAMELAMENGALDVMAAPVTMKKGRLGTLLTVLTKPENGAELEALLFRETTTIGIRRRIEERSILDRSFETVETAFGKIRVKIASAAGEQRNAMPEYEDCRRAAREHGAPLKTVMDAALAAFAESKAHA